MASGCGGELVRRQRCSLALNDAPAPLLRLPHIVEQLDHLLVDDEDDGHVQAHSAEPGNGSLVKAGKRNAVGCLWERNLPSMRCRGNSRLRSFMLQDLEGTVCCVFVAMGL